MAAYNRVNGTYADEHRRLLTDVLKDEFGFETVTLGPGERTTVDVDVDDRAFAVYDEAVGDWVTDPGEYAVEVGRSSRDRRERLVVERGGLA